jgi:hypothetical protein
MFLNLNILEVFYVEFLKIVVIYFQQNFTYLFADGVFFYRLKSYALQIDNCIGLFFENIFSYTNSDI